MLFLRRLLIVRRHFGDAVARPTRFRFVSFICPNSAASSKVRCPNGPTNCVTAPHENSSSSMNTVFITSFVNRRESLFPLLTIFSSTCFASLATILPADERVGFPAVGTISPIHAETVAICLTKFCQPS
ncbi:hypothetical protein niasHT_001635 [Heterodera trifolii]|uniref:Secreted protein n=1 Tax=Heterodera trifolii TaxID=157864 RepID=A0ABD2LP61_9BILA